MTNKNKYATGGNIGSYANMGVDLLKGITDVVDILGTDFSKSEPLIQDTNNFISNSNPYFAAGGTVNSQSVEVEGK